jgi:hypothetical protein
MLHINDERRLEKKKKKDNKERLKNNILKNGKI